MTFMGFYKNTTSTKIIITPFTLNCYLFFFYNKNMGFIINYKEKINHGLFFFIINNKMPDESKKDIENTKNIMQGTMISVFAIVFITLMAGVYFSSRKPNPPKSLPNQIKPLGSYKTSTKGIKKIISELNKIK